MPCHADDIGMMDMTYIIGNTNSFYFLFLSQISFTLLWNRLPLSNMSSICSIMLNSYAYIQFCSCYCIVVNELIKDCTEE